MPRTNGLSRRKPRAKAPRGDKCGMAKACNLDGERLEYRLVAGRPALGMRTSARVLFPRTGALAVFVAGFAAGAVAQAQP